MLATKRQSAFVAVVSSAGFIQDVLDVPDSPHEDFGEAWQRVDCMFTANMLDELIDLETAGELLVAVHQVADGDIRVAREWFHPVFEEVPGVDSVMNQFLIDSTLSKERRKTITHVWPLRRSARAGP